MKETINTQHYPPKLQRLITKIDDEVKEASRARRTILINPLENENTQLINSEEIVAQRKKLQNEMINALSKVLNLDRNVFHLQTFSWENPEDIRSFKLLFTTDPQPSLNLINEYLTKLKKHGLAAKIKNECTFTLSNMSLTKPTRIVLTDSVSGLLEKLKKAAIVIDSNKEKTGYTKSATK